MLICATTAKGPQPREMTITLAALALVQAVAVLAVGTRDGARDSAGPHGQPTLFAILRTEAKALVETLEQPWDKTVEHKKAAGNGYLKGSPLYEKQEALEKNKESEKTDYQLWAKFNEDLSKGDFKAAWHDLSWWMVLQVFFNQLAYVILVLVVAFLWKKGGGKTPQLSEPMGTREAQPAWAYGLFDCSGATGEDLPICGMACCCPIIRWADTMSNPKVATSEPKAPQTGLGFWQAIGIALALVFLSPFTGGLSSLLLFSIMMYYRHKLRQIFRHSPGTLGSFCYDFWGLCCCTCCAIVQEAREVEKVMKPSRQ